MLCNFLEHKALVRGGGGWGCLEMDIINSLIFIIFSTDFHSLIGLKAKPRESHESRQEYSTER